MAAKVTRIFYSAATTNNKHANKYRKNKRKKLKQKFGLIKENGKGGPLKVYKFRKNRKSNKNFTCKKKKHFNKYRINTKNNKFWKSSYLLRTEVNKAPQKSTDFATIANENFSLLRMKHPNKYSKNIKERGPLIVRKFEKAQK